MPQTAIAGPDGLRRCPWSLSSRSSSVPQPAPDYVAYHDGEWARPVRGDDAVFERIVLEGFQSGLSWIVILRKREAFRAAFAGFSIEKVAAFGPDDVARMLADPGIVRNRRKIESAIGNARAAAEIDGGLSDFVWSFAPRRRRATRAPRSTDDVPTSTPESSALATELRCRGFRFLGPTTIYAHMQATGMVNDHLVGCAFRAAAGPAVQH